ncbi:hypothetical protein TNCV_2748971 [Trichonephila clavipes]|nr:hypothetical protein TNCV_2748971 [Trichonephila clavipes]
MEPSRVPTSPLKDPVDSKPPIVSRSPDPPVKKAHIEKVVIPLFIVLRDPGKDEMRKDGTRNEGMRNEGHETPACIEDPISNPRIEGLAVLCIRNNGFTQTNGVVSYAMDRECPNELFKFLHYLNFGTICVTDQHSKQTFKEIQASWSSSSQFKRSPVMPLNSNGRELGQCPFCNQTICHRWIAVQVHDGPNRCLPRAHFNDRGARDAARETRRIGICRSAGTSLCLHHLSGTQHETSFCRVLQRQLQQPGPSSKRNRVFITPVIRPPVLIARPSTALATPQPVSIPEPPVLTTPQILLPDPPPELTTPLARIPDPPVQIPVFQPPVQISPVPTTTPVQLFLSDPPPVQILLPDPPPVVETLELTLMDDSSIDQIMSSVFGDTRNLPRLIPKNPSCWARCLLCLTRVMISSRSWIILKQGWP